MGLVFDLTGRKSGVSDAEALWRASLEVADGLVVMQSGDNGKYRLVAASLCSPCDWRVEETLSATMAEVRGPIPRLNDEIGDQIDGSLLDFLPIAPPSTLIGRSCRILVSCHAMNGR